jgi:pyruvate dehydrogenase E2 component (dihydrolipoamide acetyltransferase)
MPANVIMPALELAQETGKLLRWIKAPGDMVRKGEPIAEIETDKVTVELEAPASGILQDVTAQEGDVVPVGHTIAIIADSASPTLSPQGGRSGTLAPQGSGAVPTLSPQGSGAVPTLSPQGRGQGEGPTSDRIKASPLARKVAEAHNVDLAHVRTASGKIEKADVLAYVESRRTVATAGNGGPGTIVAASPKARRFAAERGIDLRALKGSGPEGAVLAMDVPAAAEPTGTGPLTSAPPTSGPLTSAPPTSGPLTSAPLTSALLTLPSPQRGEGVAAGEGGGIPRRGVEDAASQEKVGTVWRVMAERMAASWTSAPHFFLVREVAVARLGAWLDKARAQTGVRITYTDLLIKLVAAAIVQHPRVAVSWRDGVIERHPDVNVGLAVALEDGLVVPVIHRADTLGLKEIAARREDLVARAQAGKLRPADIQGGVFTISNLGMYGVDAFSAIVNPPQAAILAVGRITDRVIPVDGKPAVQPTMVLTLSCDHRALDGARGARFLGALADLIEEPLTLLV